MDSLGVSYESIDVTENLDAYEKIVSLGYQSVPVVMSSRGDWAGFRPDKISELAA
jgi:glutaredoxin-like protein NrdH